MLQVASIKYIMVASTTIYTNRLRSYEIVPRSDSGGDGDITRVLWLVVPSVVPMSLPEYRLLACCITPHPNCCLQNTLPRAHVYLIRLPTSIHTTTALGLRVFLEWIGVLARGVAARTVFDADVKWSKNGDTSANNGEEYFGGRCPRKDQMRS